MLVLRGIRKLFPVGEQRVVALDGIDLHVPKGQFITIIGSNGAGKSTLLNAVAGVFFVDEGSILLDGQDVTFMPEHKRAAKVARVFQNPLDGTAASMTVEENIALAAARGRRRGLRRGVRAALRERTKEALARLELGLEHRLLQPAGLLSGGQRQALSLLMATMTEPSILLLDEHTAALDPKSAAHISALTERLARENGLTTLMVTHNMEQALRMGDRTIMMHGGQIILDISGPAREKMTVEDLVHRFAQIRGTRLVDDRVLLG